jgi:aspartate racemase
MKTLGMLGGLGPESTIEYYRLLFAAYRALVKDDSAPPILINSIDMNKGLRMVTAGAYGELADYLVGELNPLAAAGAHFGIISANTPHIVFDEVRERAPIPLISIIEATAAEAKRLNLKALALFGTRFTMQGSFYPKVFGREGIEPKIPTPSEQDYIHDKYMNELVKGDIRDSTRAGLLRIVDHMIERDGIDGVVLGGTELSLIIRDIGERKIALLDTTKIHVNAAIEEMLV